MRLKRRCGRRGRPPGSPPTSRRRPVKRAPRFRRRVFAGRRAGEGLPGSRRRLPHVPCPLAPGSPSRPCVQALHRCHGLHPERPGSALPFPAFAKPLTTRRAALDATDRSVAPPARAFDAGLRAGPFPGPAASLLPGLLAATRTALTQAGGRRACRCRSTPRASPPTAWAHAKKADKDSLTAFFACAQTVGGEALGVDRQRQARRRLPA